MGGLAAREKTGGAKDREKSATSGYSTKLAAFCDGAAKAAYERKPITAASRAWKAQDKTARARMPGVVSSGKLAEDDALLFLPPAGKVAKSLNDNRWRVSWSAHSRSRSWVLYGELQAFAIAAKYIWEQFQKAGGFPCPFQFITDAAEA